MDAVRLESVAAAPTVAHASGASAISVFMFADVRVYRDELARALRREQGVRVVGTSPAEPALAARVEELRPDVVLVDMKSARALPLVAELAQRTPRAKIVALAVQDDEAEIIAWIEAGVSAFVPAEGSTADVVATIWRVDRGEPVCSPHITTALIDRIRLLAEVRSLASATPLTSREVEIMRLIEQGLSNKQIAGRLSIALPTVKNHVHNILEKLNVGCRSEAVARLWGRLDPI